MCKTQNAPQVEDSILTSASETDSEAIVAFNFGGSTGVILILVLALVLTFFLYQFCRCCIPQRCGQRQRPSNDQSVNQALIQLALAIGNNQSQQQQIQQQGQENQHNVPGVSPGHNCLIANQTLLARMGKASAGTGESQGVKSIQWSQDDTESGDASGSGQRSSQDREGPTGPPKTPELTEQDILEDPVLAKALWSIIHSTQISEDGRK